MRLVLNQSDAFSGMMARLGKFQHANHYLIVAGPASDHLQTTAGYYGERIVLQATMLGLDSCWVAGTYQKRAVKRLVPSDKVLVCVVALGYGQSHGEPHRCKPIEAVCAADRPMPDWFVAGVEAALLAPTALNRQDFFFSLTGRTVSAQAIGGSFTKLNLGIAKYHFEIGAGKENFDWA